MRQTLRTELEALSNLYAQNLLRYNSFADILFDPKTISSGLILRRVGADLRVAEREIRRMKK